MRGFTLIEVVIVIGLVSVLSLVLSLFFVSAHTTYQFQTASLEAHEAASMALYDVHEALLPASHVRASESFESGRYTSGSNEVIVALPAMRSSGELVEGAHDYIALYMRDGSLYRELRPAPESARRAGVRRLAAVERFSITYDRPQPVDARSLTIEIEAVRTTRDETATAQVRQTVYLRNAP